MPLRQIHGDTTRSACVPAAWRAPANISDVPAETERALAGLDVWIVDGLGDKPHPSHFSVADALRWADRLKQGGRS